MRRSLRVPRGPLDRGGAVVGGEAVRGWRTERRRRPGRGTSRRRRHRPRRSRSASSPTRRPRPGSGVGVSCVGCRAVDVVEQLEREAVPFPADRTRRFEAVEERNGPGKQRLLCRSRPARARRPARGVDRPSCCGPRRSGSGDATTTAAPWRGPRPAPATSVGARNAAIATDRASFGSFLSERPEPNSRTRDANVAGMSTTCSPAARSCWANR